MPIDFTDLEDARDLVLARAPFATTVEVDTLLELSKGTDPDDVATFRPYVVLASLFETQWERYTALRGASGASLEYSDPDSARTGYLRQQGRLDETLELEVPEAWPASSTSTFLSGY